MEQSLVTCTAILTAMVLWSASFSESSVFISGSSLYQLSSAPDGSYPRPYASTNISAECNLS